MKPLHILAALPIAAAVSGPAAAHPGHLADLAGHDHWIGLAAVGAAVGVAVWAGLRGRGQSAKADTDQEPASDAAPDDPDAPQEA